MWFPTILGGLQNFVRTELCRVHVHALCNSMFASFCTQRGFKFFLPCLDFEGAQSYNVLPSGHGNWAENTTRFGCWIDIPFEVRTLKACIVASRLLTVCQLEGQQRKKVTYPTSTLRNHVLCQSFIKSWLLSNSGNQERGDLSGKGRATAQVWIARSFEQEAGVMLSSALLSKLAQAVTYMTKGTVHGCK